MNSIGVWPNTNTSVGWAWIKQGTPCFPTYEGANRADYTKWLRGFVDAGNTPTHYYSYPFSRWDSFYVAKKDFELVPLYGADSINIIVPEGITILGGSRGHNNIFCYNGYKHRGTVPVFSDTVF